MASIFHWFYKRMNSYLRYLNIPADCVYQHCKCWGQCVESIVQNKYSRLLLDFIDILLYSLSLSLSSPFLSLLLFASLLVASLLFCLWLSPGLCWVLQPSATMWQFDCDPCKSQCSSVHCFFFCCFCRLNHLWWLRLWSLTMETLGI